MSVKPGFFRVTTIVMTAAMLWACDRSVGREAPPVVDLQIVRADPARNRLWVLDPSGLTLYDNLNGRRLRHISLPEWILAAGDRVCAPDIAFDAAGTVFVSSDVLPVIWRVDPQRFEVARIEIALDMDADKDVGFTGLSFAGDGIVIAAGTTFPSIWRIDLNAARASKVASYPAASPTCDPGVLLRTSGRF
jgi:hypothetical protein